MDRPEILILSKNEDIHALRVLQEIQYAGGKAQILDMSGPAEFLKVAWCPGKKRVVGIGQELVLDLAGVRTIWNRRPALPQLPDDMFDVEDRRFAMREWEATIDGLFEAPNVIFVSPLKAESAASKLRQLQIANAVGLDIPFTIVTNDPEEATRFAESVEGSAVHKALTGPRHVFLETRRWRDTPREALEDLPFAPAVFQEEVDGNVDVRVVAMGGELLAAQRSSGTEEIDSRLNIDAPWKRHQVTDEVATKLRSLLKKLELKFGVIDMKINAKGKYVFFEVNPQGQFLFMEIWTGLPICRTMAEYLMGLARAARVDRPVERR